ncbi:SPFH domain-containing protein/band 7 family protein [Pararhizobium polonicum]|uniref:SPFH domain-containing protein/band 7 family protein n=1 Tax=Pararhizobium polonicum TaxID=1612624 RepID=A0A1C7NSQ7_9HYPH|nr:SPFH domain-containing protein [Pararhizobium polonicum]OBZ92023.1 SPFH domain-containing protein/band 7 family protein [Pararhizobium polonicum]
MFGLRYFKATPTTYIFQYQNGSLIREGSGLSFYYYAPRNSLVAVPLESVDVPFMFSEVSSDFQEVTIQGQLTYRITEPKTIAGLMNFAIRPNGAYVSEDIAHLPQRAVNAVQVQLRAILQNMTLRELLRGSEQIVKTVRSGLSQPEALPSLGLGLIGLAILAVKPNPETARALEAQVREEFLKQADDATYTRRNSAIEQERAIRENELNTEIAIETKNRQIVETKMEAERSALEKRQQIQDQDLTGKIALEDKNKALTALRAGNARIEADARAYALAQLMKAVEGIDPRVLQALMIGQADSSTLIAAAFQNLANSAEKIGELNISPDLLQALAEKPPMERPNPQGRR